MNTIQERLDRIAIETSNPEIRWTALNYSSAFKEGSLGSNSVGLMAFLQNPIEYNGRNGPVVMGVE